MTLTSVGFQVEPAFIAIACGVRFTLCDNCNNDRL